MDDQVSHTCEIQDIACFCMISELSILPCNMHF